MADDAELLHIVIRGQVQGVGFRYYTLRQAKLLGVQGWTRNLPGGEVEVLARIPTGARGRFLAALQQGPPGARVDGLQVGAPPPDAPPAGAGFHVIH
jgi:acylphosphatase